MYFAFEKTPTLASVVNKFQSKTENTNVVYSMLVGVERGKPGNC